MNTPSRLSSQGEQPAAGVGGAEDDDRGAERREHAGGLVELTVPPSHACVSVCRAFDSGATHPQHFIQHALAIPSVVQISGVPVANRFQLIATGVETGDLRSLERALNPPSVAGMFARQRGVSRDLMIELKRAALAATGRPRSREPRAARTILPARRPASGHRRIRT